MIHSKICLPRNLKREMNFILIILSFQCLLAFRVMMNEMRQEAHLKHIFLLYLQFLMTLPNDGNSSNFLLHQQI